MTYKIRAIIVDQKSKRVKAVDILQVEYEFNQALEAVDLMEKHRDQNERFGTIRNPLRFEAYSKCGIAARF